MNRNYQVQYRASNIDIFDWNKFELQGLSFEYVKSLPYHQVLESATIYGLHHRLFFHYSTWVFLPLVIFLLPGHNPN